MSPTELAPPVRRFLVLACLVLFPATLFLAARAAAPIDISQKVINNAVRFDPAEVDLGELPQQSRKEVLVEITNRGHRPHRVIDISASCGCTVASMDNRELDPGETSVMQIVFEAGLEDGRFRKTVTLLLDDGTQTTLDLVGDVRARVRIWPNPVVFGYVGPGETVTRTVNLVSSEVDEPVEIEEITSNTDALDIAQPRRDGRGYSVELTARPDHQHTRIDGHLFIKTNRGTVRVRTLATASPR